MRSVVLLSVALAAAAPASAQTGSGATIHEMASTPLVRVSISESLRAAPDEASLAASTQAKASTAKEAVAANKAKTERLLAAIRAAGIRERDLQTEGVRLSPDYRYDRTENGGSQQKLVGYVASNAVRIKTRDITALTALLDKLTEAGADTVNGPMFGISDPAPLRREARARAMSRGYAEATEHARNNNYGRVRLLSVEEGMSYQGTDIVVTGSRISSTSDISAPAPPPPPPPPGGIIAPGQIETIVRMNMLFRMER